MDKFCFINRKDALLDFMWSLHTWVGGVCDVCASGCSTTVRVCASVV